MIAAGLSLTWTNGQKAEFAAYLSANKEVSFNYKKTEYHITAESVRIYPQSYAAIADFASTLSGVNMAADIGNGTMNVPYMINGRPQPGKMYPRPHFGCRTLIKCTDSSVHLISHTLKYAPNRKRGVKSCDHKLRQFIMAVKKQPLVLKEWDERLWVALIVKAAVYLNGRIVFAFKSGKEIEVER